jgi:hypothetical protein
MVSKLDKIARLTEGLQALPEPAAAPKAKRPVGVPVTLRMPPEMLAHYAAEAGRRSVAAGRTITAQAVMLEALAIGVADRG